MRNNFATIATILAGFFLATSIQAQGSLEGAWQVEEVVVSSGENAGTYSDPEPNILLFTEGHFSRFTNFGERPEVPEGPLQNASPELIGQILNTFRANAGTYETSGSKVMFHFMMARMPGAVGNTPEAEYRIEGNKLTMTGTNNQGVETTTTYMRLD